MDKGKARIKDIAKKAGVSHGTVDRVIHDRGEVSEATRKRIKQIIKELNYEPDLSARSLASRKTYRLAVCIPYSQQESSFWQSPIIGIDKATNEIKHLGITNKKFLFDQADKNSFKEMTRQVIEYNPDGLIIAPVYPQESDWLLKICNENNIPYVFINSNLEGENNLTFIGQDDKQSGKVAGKLMKNCLSEDEEALIVHLAKSIDTHPHFRNRQKGFESCFEYQNKIHVAHITSNEQESINQRLSELLAQYPGIKGIFVTNSKAFRVARYLEENHLEIFLVGYDLIEENLSHLEKETINYLISQKPFDQGYLSVKALFNFLVLNKNVQWEYRLPIEIIMKENMNHLNISNSL
jgi:LacI family transcriptional regulator